MPPIGERTAPCFGQATITPQDDVIAGAFGTWTITVTVGDHGIDDGGRVLLARHLVANWGMPQFDRPQDAEYATVTTNGKARLVVRLEPKAFVRPWKAAVVIDVVDGALAPGDQITVTFGDTRWGSPGSRAQTFRQDRHEFPILVDAFGTGQFVRLPDCPTLRILGGPAARLRVRAPSEVLQGEPFAVTVVAEDRFGNPSDGYEATVELHAESSESSGQAVHRYSAEARGAHRFEGLRLSSPGIHRLIARDLDRSLQAVGNPIICRAEAPPRRLFWGDIHGQTEASVGTGTVEQYFTFGRDVAALDFAAHCANDFQVTADYWQEIRDGVHRHHQPGRYVTFLAYEWSGTTPAGGDHNVYYRDGQGPLHRSSHWQIADRSDEADDRYPISALHETLRGRDDVMIIPHVGGRHANLDFFDAEHTPLIEIASVHGVFEWLAEEALRRGLRVGFIASSDDHTGRLGATYPSGSAVHFGMRGGLVAAYAEALTREALWEAFWARRCYGTTGERMILRVDADGQPMGSQLTATTPPLITVEVLGTGPLDIVELRRGTEVVYSHPLLSPDSGEKPLLRLAWEGARVRWRERPTVWDGSLMLDRGRIVSVQPFAFDNPEDGILAQEEQAVRWRSSTSGDSGGLLLDFDAPDDAHVSFETGPVRFGVALNELTASPIVIDAGGLGQRVTASWVSRREPPSQVSFSYRESVTQPGDYAYWLRVMQRDGAMAWSSPIWVHLAA